MRFLLRITDAKKCIRCKEYISKTDMVMKIRTLTYHAACFSCSSCEKKLTVGEEFVFREREDDVLCRVDCDATNIEQPSSIKTDIYGREDEDGWDGSTLTSLDNQMSSTPPLSLRSPKSDEIVTTFNSSKSQMKKNKKDKQSTRVRTVLNEKQLMTLKACYAANARPDAMMKEHLVEMTGLSPRVIRVWFQNKRCKDKKRQIAMKHLQQKAETERAITGVRLGGVGPLIAASPTPHSDPNLIGIQPVDIHQFPQNPNIWSGLEAINAQGGMPQPQHASLQQSTLQQPSPYAQIMPPPPPHYADLGNDLSSSGYSNMMSATGPNNHLFSVNMGTDLEFSPQVNASDLSSPSCSE
ncbi:Uncharacterized protein BM_BM12860 [Brugia malayi]|uniref:BMA-LIM-7, isoform z n=1 Tax=Brugia malayi TaxID=6279 RepID=A0A1P6BKA7_BRUMA|nr:Uncharacterized protein BM_BM12860 [Brugia malayi]CDQ02207.1 BMA-LIM-7, isoform z [Brugia malayi]VIO96283.1 Uncharacterized protein BM_BM12860 [Brugia malayi]